MNVVHQVENFQHEFYALLQKKAMEMMNTNVAKIIFIDSEGKSAIDLALQGESAAPRPSDL